MTVYEAAMDLCRRAGVEVPWIKRWQAPEEGPCRLPEKNREEAYDANQRANTMRWTVASALPYGEDALACKTSLMCHLDSATQAERQAD
jgi:hypothetical protein